MSRRERLWHLISEHPRLADLALAAGFYSALLCVPIYYAGPATSSATQLVVDGVICGTLVLRRRWPISVLVIAVAGLVLERVGLDASRNVALIATVALAVATYTVVSLGPRRVGVSIGVTTAFGLWIAVSVWTGSSLSAPANVNLLAGLAIATALADSVRHRRAYVAAIEDRARDAEQDRERESERRVVAERLRIARELHDVVTHHIAVIQVQSGVAAHLLRADPDAAETAVAHVRRAGHDVLEELSALLAVLRSSDDAVSELHDGHPAAPVPGLDRLNALVDDFTASGLDLHVAVHGVRVPLSAATDLTAYRLIQESLTNAHKHGGNRVDVTVTYGAADVDIAVINSEPPVRPHASITASHATAGRGLLGMRERVAAVGGSLSVGRGPHGCYVVRAQLPRPLDVAPNFPGHPIRSAVTSQ